MAQETTRGFEFLCLIPMFASYPSYPIGIMTDETVAKPVQISVGFGPQYIKDFSFESPHAPHIFGELQNQPQMGLDVNVMSRGFGNGTYESILHLRLETKISDKLAYIVELSYGGVFTLPDLPEEQTKVFLMVEAPRLLYPYARAIISNAVQEGGFPSISMQPIDFLSLYTSQRGSIVTETPEQSA